VKALLDTHAAVAFWENRPGAFGPESQGLIERATLLCSPVALLELGYLFEVGKLNVAPLRIWGDLLGRLEVQPADCPILDLAMAAIDLSWTRDPFDRLIVATAAILGTRLITRDRLIRAHFGDACW